MINKYYIVVRHLESISIKATMMIDPLISIFGLSVGILIGVAGMGGGSIATPLLILLFGVRPIVAVGTDLAFMAITKSFGAVQHYRQGTFDITLLKHLIIAAVPGSIIGIIVTNTLRMQLAESVDLFIRDFLAYTLIIVVGLLILQYVIRNDQHRLNVTTLCLAIRSHRIPLYIIGATAGFLISITSIGGGVLILPFLLLLYPVHTKKLIGTDISLATILSIIGGIGYLIMGTINIFLLFSLLIGSIPGVYMGSKINGKLPTHILKIFLMGILFTVAIILLR